MWMSLLTFWDVKEDQIKNVIAILRCFKAISGLEVNLFKNALFGILVEDHLLCYLANTTEYKVGSFLTSYLGLPLSLGSVSKSLWNPILERVEQKLTWKARYLSLGGRTTLILPWLISLSTTCFSSNVKCWSQITERNWSATSFGRAMITRENSILLTEKLFAGPRKGPWLRTFKTNEPSSARQVVVKRRWWIDYSPWRQVIWAKYGVRRNGWEIPSPNHRSSEMWSGIVSAKDNFENSIRYQVGSSHKFFF